MIILSVCNRQRVRPISCVVQAASLNNLDFIITKYSAVLRAIAPRFVVQRSFLTERLPLPVLTRITGYLEEPETLACFTQFLFLEVARV